MGYCMRKLMSNAEFKLLDDTTKKKTLEYWRSKYTNRKIYEHLGISEPTFYNLLYKYNVEREKKYTKTRLTGEQINEIVNGGKFSKEGFLQLIDSQQSIIISEITKKYTVTEIADLWGTSKDTILKFMANNIECKIDPKIKKVINGGKFSKEEFESLHKIEKTQIMTGISGKIKPKAIADLWGTDVKFIYNRMAIYNYSNKYNQPNNLVKDSNSTIENTIEDVVEINNVEEHVDSPKVEIMLPPLYFTM